MTDCLCGSKTPCNKQDQNPLSVPAVPTLPAAIHDTHSDNSGSDDDSVWASDSDDGPQNQQVEPDIAAVRRKFAKRGYIDGKTEWQEKGLQMGFDTGYTVGATLALEAGEVLAVLQLKGNGELVEKAGLELNITRLLSSEYFDDEAELKGGKHPVLEQWKDVVKDL